MVTKHVSTTDPETTYRERTREFGTLRDRESRRSTINGNISLGLIICALILFGLWLWQNTTGYVIGAALFTLGFVVSFVHHGGVNQALRRYTELYTMNDEGLRRLRREWSTLPLRDPQPAEAAHPYAADLDLLGRSSLEHLLHTPNTPVGQQTLRNWLLTPAAPNVVRDRQEAVAELAPLVAWRDDLALRGRLMSGTQPRYEQFIAWAESEPWLLQRPWLIWLSRVLAIAALALLAGLAAGLPLAVPFAVVWLVNLLLNLTFARHVELRIEQVSQKQSVFDAYADLFHLCSTSSFAATELLRVQSELRAGTLRADQQMRRLGRIMPLAEIRKWMFFFPIQVTTLWSFHVLWLLERWQRDAGPRARVWLAALGQIEALAAIATLLFDNPRWVFPTLWDQPVLSAHDLGHPLLPQHVRVGNDVTLGPPGDFLLITGSNMSGKSTLLRSIGVNAVLAQAGGPVCAAEMQLGPLSLATSMRVQDSLEQGVSYFMAELQRLKLIVELAEQVRAEGSRTLLFLLDEILHGTNTTERQIAARLIIRHLLDQGATGAVSTHDLALADAPDLANNSTTVHFTEQFTRGSNGLAMHFDYKLRPGVATSTNALKLMEMIGLPVAELTPHDNSTSDR